MVLCLISVRWILFGYALAFGPDSGLGFILNFYWIGLENVHFRFSVMALGETYF